MPRELLDLIEAGRWHCPDDQTGIDRLFPERGEFCLYSFEMMRSETEGIQNVLNTMWWGAIDLRRVVFIADLGIGYDQPVAFDYRVSLEHPRVMTVRWKSHWVEIAPNIERFAAILRL